MMNPLRTGFYAFQLLSHKVMRYLMPTFLIAILIASAVLARDSTFYLVMLAGQLAFYSLALAGWLLERAGKRSKLLALPHYFVLANLASLLAFNKFLRGERYAYWETAREPTS
jgi:signal transduction histidine kinase